MRIPVWARGDSSTRLKFFCHTMACFHSKHCTLAQLSNHAGLKPNTVWRSMEKGRLSKKTALALTQAVPDLGINPLWLMAPDLIHLNEHGDIIE